MTRPELSGPPSAIDRLLAPLRDFIHAEVSGGLLLLAATIAALMWANSPAAGSYAEVWQAELRIGTHGFGLTKPLQLWINDGLMAIFFFVVGLEIKRELLIGELASLRRALLPMVAALGGAVVPAAIYLGFTFGTPASAGWGVPMATDIAFALGVLALLGSRVPIGLKIFVTALAIVDDLIAIVVIAVFYSGDLSLPALGIAGGLVLALVIANRLGIRRHLVYGVLGVALWAALLASGIHATIAGVLLAVTVPATTRIDGPRFIARAREVLDRFAAADDPDADVRRSESQQAALLELDELTEAIQAPLQRLEHGLHPWVAYLIVPLFALANAGVAFGQSATDALASPLAYGVVAGLVVGKQLGILGASWVVVKTGWAELPAGVGWRHVWGAGWVAGIGFTMSLFIGELAFGSADLNIAKIAILVASVLAALGAWLVLRGAASDGVE
jgi:Na+:H+ antiporter, NhaA family